MIQRLKDYVGRWHPKNRSDDYRRSVRNAAFNAGEGVITPVLWVISTPIFISKLGIDHFGIWLLVNSVIGMGGILSLGLTDATTKYVSKYRAANDLPSARRVTQATLLLYLVLGAVAAAATFTLAPTLSGQVFKLADEDRAVARLALQIGGLGILARFLDNVFFSVFQGFERYDLNARITVLINTLTISLNIGLALSGFGLATMLITTVSFIFVGSLLKAMVIQRKVDSEMHFIPRCTRASFQELMSFGLFTGVQRALALLVTYSDRFLLATYAGMTGVAYYTVCLQLVSQIVALLNRGGAFLFPLAASLQERGDRNRLRRVYNKSHVVLVILTCGLMIPVYVCSGSILKLWMGSDFSSEATLLLSLLCLRFAFAPLAVVNSNFLMGMGHVKLQAGLVFLSSTFLLAGMAYLIPNYGALGAVCAQFILFPFMILNRYVVDRRLFDQLNLGQMLCFYLPVLLCLALASLFALFVDPSSYSLWELMIVGPLTAGISAAIAWTVLRICQRAGLFAR